MSDLTPPPPFGGDEDEPAEHAEAFADGGAAFSGDELGAEAELTVPAEWAEEAAEILAAEARAQAEGEGGDIAEPGREEIVVPVPQPPDEASERLRDDSKRAIEALVMVAEEPLPSNLLGQLLEVSPVVVDRLCEELATAYEVEGRGFQLVRVAGGWRFQSHPDQSAYIERMVLQGQTAKLSAAALETLAIVAYKQPISRAQVASIRGVSVDGVMRTLEQRGYIAQIGVDPGPGQALLFGTTPSFLEKVGLDNLDELPPLGDFVPGSDVVEQLERGLRPDRQPLRPEDALGPNDAMAMPGDIAPPTLSGTGPTNGHRPAPGYVDDLGDVDLGEVDTNPGAGYEGRRSATDDDDAAADEASPDGGAVVDDADVDAAGDEASFDDDAGFDADADFEAVVDEAHSAVGAVVDDADVDAVGDEAGFVADAGVEAVVDEAHSVVGAVVDDADVDVAGDEAGSGGGSDGGAGFDADADVEVVADEARSAIGAAAHDAEAVGGTGAEVRGYRGAGADDDPFAGA